MRARNDDDARSKERSVSILYVCERERRKSRLIVLYTLNKVILMYHRGGVADIP